MVRVKKTPEQKGKGAFVRMCAACGKKQHKDLMFRISASADGAILTSMGSVVHKGFKTGKSSYICKDPACVSKCEKSHRPEKLIGCAPSKELYEKIKGEHF